MSNPLQIIASIHNDHSKTNHEKQSLLQAIIQPDLNQPDKDVLSFVLQLTTATNEDLSAAMQALEHYSPLFIDIVQSPHLVAFLSWLRSLHADTSSSRILSSALTMIKLSWRLNIEHRPIPSEHVSAITALSLTILSNESLVLAEQASRLLEVVLSRGVNLDLLSQLYDCVRAQASHPSATTLRYLSLGASLCKTNDDVARDCVGRGGLVARTFEICRSNDLLLAINALSLLTQFSESGAGLEELCRETVLDWLITVGCGNQRTNQAPDPLLEAEVLRVLADVFIQAAKSSHEFVAQISGECIESFLSRVHDYLDEGNEEHKITALGLLADFSMISSQTLSLLQTYRSGALLSLWLRLLNSSKTELSSAALSALVRLFDQSDDLYVTNSLPATNAPNSVFALPSANAASEEQIAAEKEKICSIKRALFQRIGEVKGGGVTSLHYLVKAAKQPVSSLRLAAVDLLRSLAQQRTGWGIRELFNQGYEVAQCEFWLYLGDRTTEFSKEGKDFKFALVEAVWQSSYRHLLGEEVNAQLQAMISQGAYYMPPRLQEMETL